MRRYTEILCGAWIGLSGCTATKIVCSESIFDSLCPLTRYCKRYVQCISQDIHIPCAYICIIRCRVPVRNSLKKVQDKSHSALLNTSR